MENDRDNILLQEMVGYLENSHNKVPIPKKLLSLRELSSLCTDYSRASVIYQHFTQVLQKDTCDLQLLVAFVETCGQHLPDWVTQEGSRDSLALFLDFSTRVKFALYKKGLSSKGTPDYHPVNQSLLDGRMANVPMLLHYGFGLEFSESFYERLQMSIVKRIVPHPQRRACLRKINQYPNWRRMSLVLLVIRTYNYMEKFPRFYKGAHTALRMIWRSIPDVPLCRKEFFEIFEGMDADIFQLKDASEHYGKFICEEPYSKDLSQPRSLAHHSRCAIRKALSLNRELPYGVHKLPIPTKLVPFILLEVNSN